MAISPYLIVYGLLLLSAVICCVKRYEGRAVFLVSMVLLTAFLALRYGQGTDYFSYRYLYYSAPDNLRDMVSFFIKPDSDNARIEPLYRAVTGIFRVCGASYQVFIAFFSVAEMALLYRFVTRFCPRGKALALLLIYPTLYLTYCFSTLRQGMAICLFLGLMLPLLLDKKIVPYLLLGLVCVGLHTSSFILLLLPLALLIPLKWWRLLLPVCLLGAAACASPWGIALLTRVTTALGKGEEYLASSRISPLALGERVCTFAFIAVLYRQFTKTDKDQTAQTLMRLYCAGMGLYLILCWQPLLSSRMMAPLKMLEIALLCFLYWKLPRLRYVILAYAALLTGVMTVKNLQTYLGERAYPQTAFWQYPYYSVLHPERTLSQIAFPARYRLADFHDGNPVYPYRRVLRLRQLLWDAPGVKILPEGTSRP